VPIAKQICDALEYAHEHGIVHRDLKPSNIKVTTDDAVKVLDFGLAKALEGDAGSADIANSPTISQMATEAGVLLGTAAYMSPEQAKAKPVDRRADIWAFGCVLYEMLTAKRPFHRETAADTLAAVIKEDADWSQLPAATPNRIVVLLQRCLQKDPKQRLQAIGEARIALDEVRSGAPEAAPSLGGVGRRGRQWRLWIAAGLAGVLALATVVLAFLYTDKKPRPADVVRYEISPPQGASFRSWLGGFAGNFAVSPDGRKLAFLATGTDGQHLWVRSLDTLDSRVLDGTEGALGWPIWSADSRFIAFGAHGKLLRIEATGGTPLALCDAPPVVGGVWTPDDKIVFGSPGRGLWQIAGTGGVPVPITANDPAYPGVPQGFASLLPDGRHFVYGHEIDPAGRGGIYVASVDTKPEEQSSKKLLANVSRVAYAPSSDDPYIGYLLFVRTRTPDYPAGTLMAQPFDARRMEFTGDAIPVAEQVLKTGFSTSSTGILVYVSGAGVIASLRGVIQGQLTWFDRQGKALGTVGEPGLYRTLALSPDGKRAAFERAEMQTQNWDIWVDDLARGASTRFTFDPVWDSNPVWSPDGSHIAFASNRGGPFNLYQKASNLSGEDELLFQSSDEKLPTSWSPDGRSLLYFTYGQIWLLPVGNGEQERKPVPVVESRFSEVLAKFSPNGRWIAYQSNESGKDEIYVQPFDSASLAMSFAGSTPATGKWIVSNGGGHTPLWRADGKELFYLAPEGNAMAVAVNTAGAFQAGVPRVLFKVPPGLLFWDVSPNGKRFLFPVPKGANAQMLIQVVVNWQATLKK
jgi:eukaryotic-like serine/threonine-protein kinase